MVETLFNYVINLTSSDPDYKKNVCSFFFLRKKCMFLFIYKKISQFLRCIYCLKDSFIPRLMFVFLIFMSVLSLINFSLISLKLFLIFSVNVQ